MENDPLTSAAAREARAQRLESLGGLAAGLAHDFKNLLVGVLVNAQLAMNRLPDDEGAERVRGPLVDITKVVSEASALCDRMLAYAGRGVVQRRLQSLNGLMQTGLELVGNTLPTGTKVELSLSTEDPVVLGDDVQLKQVVTNLILNAGEAAGAGGVIRLETGTLDCSTEYLEQAFVDASLSAGAYAYFSVSDDGPGIPPAVRDRMFEPFFSTKTGGRGLGLASVLGVVRLHAGAIQVYSEPGRGTSCKVFLPLGGTPTPRAATSMATGDWKAAGTVLLVDDDPTIRNLGRQILEDVGFSVLTADDGLQGVQCLSQHRGEIVAVLLDLAMPQMDGVEALEALREIEDIPILLMSGYPEADVMRQVSGQAVAGFVEKPYRPETLLRTIRQVLGL